MSLVQQPFLDNLYKAVPECLRSPESVLLELRVMEVVLVTTGAIRLAKLQSNRHQQTNTQFLQVGRLSRRPRPTMSEH